MNKQGPLLRYGAKKMGGPPGRTPTGNKVDANLMANRAWNTDFFRFRPGINPFRMFSRPLAHLHDGRRKFRI